MNAAEWQNSDLPYSIVQALADPRSLTALAAELQVTDARVLWYLQRLESSGYVSCDNGAWSRTPAGVQFLAGAPHRSDDVSVMPGRTVYDFRQAYADAAAGMFGGTYVQAGGEHGSRLSNEQAQEFRQRLQDLIAEYFAPGRGDRAGTKYGLHWVFTPTDLHPLGDHEQPLS